MTILLLLLSLGINVSSYCEAPEGNLKFFEETHRYALLNPIPITYEQLIPFRYVVRYDTLQYSYTVIDSIQSQSINAADSNVIVYTDIGEEFTYLVALILSPTIVKDTLLMMRNDDPSNWLNRAPRMLFALSDSILVLPRRTAFNLDIEIIKILPGNNWEIDLKIPNIRSVSMSHDFTQILVCLDSCYKSNFSAGSIIIYELALDSLYGLKELGVSNFIAKRRSRDSHIFVLKKHERQTDIWKYSKDGKPIKIAEYNNNGLINTFSLYYNRVFLIMRDDSDPSNVRYPTRNIYD